MPPVQDCFPTAVWGKQCGRPGRNRFQWKRKTRQKKKHDGWWWSRLKSKKKGKEKTWWWSQLKGKREKHDKHTLRCLASSHFQFGALTCEYSIMLVFMFSCLYDSHCICFYLLLNTIRCILLPVWLIWNSFCMHFNLETLRMIAFLDHSWCWPQ